MKFRAVINDNAAMKEFLNIILTLSKLDKSITLNIHPEKLVLFICCADSDSTPVFWCNIKANEYFSEYAMGGVDSDHNEIYLAFNAQYMVSALNYTRNTLNHVKIKLTKKQHPCLTIEVDKPSTTSSDNREIINDVPIIIIPRKDWHNFQLPTDLQYELTATLPKYKSFKSLMEKMKNLSPATQFCLSAKGEASFVVETDRVTVASHYSNLRIAKHSPDISSDFETSCKIDSKKLFNILSACQFIDVNIFISIIQDHLLKIDFSVRDDCKLNCILPAVSFD